MFTTIAHRIEDLRARYAEAHRGYHTQSHIDALLRTFREIRPMLRCPDAVEIAVWYHDALYDPAAKDNEEASVRLMHAHLDGVVHDGVLRWAETMILATKAHQLPSGLEPNSNLAHDCALFLDMDLSMLGATQSVFDQYEAGIAMEYMAIYDEQAYQDGRVAVLEQFLARERLYFSDYFHERLEEPARTNLARCIGILRASNPGTNVTP